MNELHIFDAVPAAACEKKVLLWDRYAERDGEDSILDLQERYFTETRAEFLRFIHAFGEHRAKGRSVRDHLRLPGGFSAWWLTRLFERHPEFYGGVLYDIFKLRALERLLLSLEAPSVCLHSADTRLARVMGDLCRALYIPFAHHPPQAPRQSTVSARGNPPMTAPETPTFANVAARFRRKALVNRLRNALGITRFAWRWWRDTRPVFPRKPALTPGRGLLLGTWFPNVDAQAAGQGRFRSKYWESVHDVLSGTGKPVHWLFIHTGSAEAARDNVRLRDTFLKHEAPGADMVFWEECVSAKGAFRAWRQALRLAWKAYSLLGTLPDIMRWPGSALNVCPLLAGIWKDSTQGRHLMWMLLIHEGIRRYCELIGPQERVITSSELQFWERLLFREQRLLGCAHICAVEHTRISGADFRYLIAPEAWGLPAFVEMMPDTFFCNGEGSLAIMRESGFPEERLGMLEAVRFMHLAQTPPEPAPGDGPGAARLLVATSYFPKLAEQAVAMLASASKRADSAGYPAASRLLERVCVKPHPFLPVERQLRERFENPPRTADGDVEDFLTPGTVVLTDGGTSIGLLALYRGLPLIECLPGNGFRLSGTPENAGARFVKNGRELLDALEATGGEAAKTSAPPSALAGFFCLDPGLPRWRKLLLGESAGKSREG